MVKKMLPVIITIIVILVLAAFAVLIGLFLIGSVKDVDSVGVRECEVSARKIEVSFEFSSSADVMSSYSHRIKDGSVYIRMRSVLVGVLPIKTEIEIKGDFSDIEKVYFEDNGKSKLIWEKPEIPENVENPEKQITSDDIHKIEEFVESLKNQDDVRKSVQEYFKDYPTDEFFHQEEIDWGEHKQS